MNDWYALPAEWAEARVEGLARHVFAQTKLGLYSTPRIHDDESEHIIGACAEYGFARGAQLPPPDFYAHYPKDPGYDFKPAIGRIDVKGVRCEPWFLPVKDSALEKRPGADYYALVYCPEDLPECYLVGFATRAEMETAPHVDHVLDPTRRQPRSIEDIPGRFRYVNELHPGGLLVEAVRAGVPASLWVCRACQTRAFSAVRPTCATCADWMVEANTYAVVTGGTVVKMRVVDTADAWF